MFELNFEIDYTTVIILAYAICTLLLQLFLCFRAKRTCIKLLPVLLLIVSTIVFLICSASINGWDGFVYLFFAFLSCGLIIMCGVGWVIWKAVRKRKR